MAQPHQARLTEHAGLGVTAGYAWWYGMWTAPGRTLFHSTYSSAHPSTPADVCRIPRPRGPPPRRLLPKDRGRASSRARPDQVNTRKLPHRISFVQQTSRGYAWRCRCQGTICIIGGVDGILGQQDVSIESAPNSGWFGRDVWFCIGACEILAARNAKYSASVSPSRPRPLAELFSATAMRSKSEHGWYP